MKNFFKKLSFVMALAMIISVIAPAAGAFAASAPALSAKGTKYLYLGNATKSSLDLNVTNKPAGASYVWSSSKKTVATVDKYGVVKGVKQGKTTVSLAITKKDGSKTTLSVDFVVRNNIKEFTSIVSADGADLAKLEAGKAYDLNSKFTTNGGSTTSTSSVARWSVDSDKATIDVKTGLFTATEAGTYKVTVNAFETATGADAWVALNDKASTAGVKATGTFEVTVINKITKVTQVDQYSLKVDFAGATDATKDNLSVAYLVNGTPILQSIESIKLSDDKKSATVKLYGAFNAGTYRVTATDLGSAEFTVATTKVADVSQVVVDTKEAVVLVATDVVVKLLNKDGVDITTPDLLNRVTLESSSERVYFDASAKKVTLYNIGDQTTIKATFHTYEYDKTTGEEIGFVTGSSVITAVDKVTYAVGSITAWTIAESGDKANFTTVNHVVPAEEKAGLSLFIKALKTDGKTSLTNTDVTPDADGNNVSTHWKFESSDITKLIVYGQKIYPVKAGNVAVVAYYDDKVVGAINITVTAPRAATNFSTADATSFSLSNADGLEDSKTVTFTLKDQYDAKFAFDGFGVTPVSEPQSATFKVVATPNAATGTVKFDAEDAKEGVYVFRVSSNNFSRNVVVTVNQPKDKDGNPSTVATSYKLNVETGTNYDLALSADVTKVVAKFTVVGYAANGVAVSKEIVTNEPADTGLYVTLVNPKNANVFDLGSGTYGNPDYVTLTDETYAITLSDVGVSTAAKQLTGTWIAKLYNNKVVIDTATLFVKDTQPAAVATVNKTVSNELTLLAAVKDCITVKIGDATISNATLELGDVIGTGKSQFVQTVKYKDATTHIEYVINVYSTITYK